MRAATKSRTMSAMTKGMEGNLGASAGIFMGGRRTKNEEE
jgi:hypothetical protein